MLRRTLSALAMVPLLLIAILYRDPWIFQILCLLCIGVALHEYFAMVWPTYPAWQQWFATGTGLACTAWWIWGTGLVSIALVIPTILVFLAFCFLGVQASLAEAHHRVGHFVFGIFYVAGMGVHLAWLRALPDGAFWIFLVLAATWFNDTLAYFTGHAWGRHRMAPSLSPGKTWEGWLGGLAGSALGVLVLWWFWPNPLQLGEAVCLIFLSAIFGPMGDLAESLLKRSSGVKDSGHVIPGHGGMLDRIDALLFTAPLFYYFALWVST